MAGEFRHGDVGSQLAEAEYDSNTAHSVDGQVRGDILISNTAATAFIRLAKGNNGTLLQMNANDAEWGTNIDVPGTLDVTGVTTLDDELHVGASPDAGATGEVLVSQGSAAPEWESVPPRNVLIWASAMLSPSSNGAADGTVDGTNIKYLTKDFDKDTEEHADFSIEIPPEYTGGNILWRAIWTAAAGSAAETVAFEVNILNVANDEVIDAALTDIGSMTDALLATGDRHLSDTFTQSTGLPSAGETMFVRISRDIAADNLAADARLIAVLIQIPVRGS